MTPKRFANTADMSHLWSATFHGTASDAENTLGRSLPMSEDRRLRMSK